MPRFQELYKDFVLLLRFQESHRSLLDPLQGHPPVSSSDSSSPEDFLERCTSTRDSILCQATYRFDSEQNIPDSDYERTKNISM